MRKDKQSAQVKNNTANTKNKWFALLGFFAAILLFTFPLQYAKYFWYNSGGANVAGLQHNIIFPSLQLYNVGQISVWLYAIGLGLLPLISVLGIEASALLARKVKNRDLQLLLLFFQFSIITVLLINLILFIVGAIFQSYVNPEVEYLMMQLKYNFQERAVLAFLVTFIIFGYMSLALARLTNFFADNTGEKQQRTNNAKVKK